MASSSSLLFNFDDESSKKNTTLLHLKRQPDFLLVLLEKSSHLYQRVFQFLSHVSEHVGTPLSKRDSEDIESFSELRITPESLHFATYTLKIPLNHIKEVLSVFSKKQPLPVDVVGFLDEFSTQTPMGAFKHLEEEGKYPFAIDGSTPSIHPFVLKKDTKLRIHQHKAVSSAVVRWRYKKNEGADENENINSLELAKKRGASLILEEEETVCKGECEGGCSEENCGIQIARSGVIEMSCGSGKSLTAISAAMKIGKSFLILCTNAESVVQWKREILTWTTIPASRICCITGENKDKLPIERGCVVVATYTIFTEARSLESKSMIAEVLKRVWGTLVLDECHHIAAKTISDMLPRIKAKWKLGLSGTLVREDGGIEDIFKTIGPLLFKADVEDLRKAGSIAKVLCTQISVPMEDEFSEFHSDSRNIQRTKTILSVMNTYKYLMTEYLVNFHERQANTKIIIFIDYLFELEEYSRRLNRPSIHGKTTKEERILVLKKFRDDPNYKTLLMSRVGDQSLNIPECNVAIQVSAHFGSRRQEGQRLGRILRPKTTSHEGKYDGCFYTLVSEDTKEIQYAKERAQYLVEEMSCEYQQKSINKVAIEQSLQSLGIRINPEVNKRWTKKTFEECEKLIKDYEVNGKSKKGKNKSVSEESNEEEEEEDDDDDEEEESDESNSESNSTNTTTIPLLLSLNNNLNTTSTSNSSSIGIKRSFPNVSNNNPSPRLESFTRNTFLSSLSSPFTPSTKTTLTSTEKKSKTDNNVSTLEKKSKKKRIDSSTPTLTSYLSTDNFLMEKTNSQQTNPIIQPTTTTTITITTEIKHPNNNSDNNHDNHTFPNTNTEKANPKEEENDNMKESDQESEKEKEKQKEKGKGKENVVNAENPMKTTPTSTSKPISSLNIVSRKPLPSNKFQPTLPLKKFPTSTPNPP